MNVKIFHYAFNTGCQIVTPLLNCTCIKAWSGILHCINSCDYYVYFISNVNLTSCRRKAATIYPRPCDLDLLTLKVVSESRVTWATFVPISVFLGLSVLDLGPMYATDRRQTASLLNARGITKQTECLSPIFQSVNCSCFKL